LPLSQFTLPIIEVMKFYSYQPLWSSLIGLGSAMVASSAVFAQVGSSIRPDETLGSQQSQVIPVTPQIDRIEGGAVRGVNLFHRGARSHHGGKGSAG
jgi:hypothetical protein